MPHFFSIKLIHIVSAERLFIGFWLKKEWILGVFPYFQTKITLTYVKGDLKVYKFILRVQILSEPFFISWNCIYI